MRLLGVLWDKYPQWGRLFQHLTSPVDVREKFRKLFSLVLHKRRFVSHIHTKLTAFLSDSLSPFNKLLTALPGLLGQTIAMLLVRPTEVWPQHARRP